MEVICQKLLDQPVTILEEVEVVVMAVEEEEVEGLVDVVVVLVEVVVTETNMINLAETFTNQNGI